MQSTTRGNEAVRSTLQNSDDPRVARTRARILDAVHQLAQAGEEISVSSIVRASGLSRAGFYTHYASLDELANTLRRNAFLEIRELYGFDRQQSDDALRRSQERLVRHFVDNRALYAAVSALPLSKESYLAGVRAMAAMIEQTLAGQPGRPVELQVTATARYIAGAAYGLLDAWSTGEIELTEAEMVNHLLLLLPEWFSNTR